MLLSCGAYTRTFQTRLIQGAASFIQRNCVCAGSLALKKTQCETLQGQSLKLPRCNYTYLGFEFRSKDIQLELDKPKHLTKFQLKPRQSGRRCQSRVLFSVKAHLLPTVRSWSLCGETRGNLSHVLMCQLISRGAGSSQTPSVSQNPPMITWQPYTFKCKPFAH